MYAVRKMSPRWPRLVREHTVDRFQGWADADELPADAEDELTDAEDEIFLLGERCARAYMQADALHYQALKLLAEFDRRSGWEDTGFSSTAEWLAWRIGIKPGAARERVRTALALEQLPQTSEAMRNGELSFTKVRALTRVATPDTETTLLDFAKAGSAANLERVVRGWKTLGRKSEVTAEQIRHRSRRFSAFVDDDGMVVVTGRLDPEVGALFMRAVEAASDALYREGWDGEVRRADPDAAADLPETKPEQRRADAVGLIAERALAAGFGVRGGGDAENREQGDEHPVQDPAPISGTRAERYQVMLHVDAGTLEEDGEPGRSELEDGTRVSAETSRRLACDASRITVTHAPDGEVIGAGRRARTVTPSVRRALEARDRGCRFPGCGLRFTEAHHVKHWADGGETSLRNSVLLCRRHHRAVHEGGVRVCIDVRQQVVFFTPRGKALFSAPQTDVSRGLRLPAEKGEFTVHGGARRNGEDGGSRAPDTGSTPQIRPVRGSGAPPQIQPAHLAGAPRWKRDGDIPWAVEARAWEALDSG